MDELPEDTRKKVLAAISGDGNHDRHSAAKGESHDAFTHEAPLTASVDEKVQAAFAYVEAKYARLMSIDEKEDFYFRLSKKFYDWDVPPSAPVGDEFSEERKAAVGEQADDSVPGYQNNDRIAQEPEGFHCCEGGSTQSCESRGA